jgi:branched-chain amino acid transport system permease protein
VRRSSVSAILLAVAVALPVVAEPYTLDIVGRGLLLGALGLSLNLLVTYGGMPSLAHAAFFGSSAYVAGLLAVNLGVTNLWVALLAGMASAAVLGAVFALVSLRTRGVYFLIITLALTAMVWGLAVKWRAVTGGDDGLLGIPRATLAPLPGSVETSLHQYLLSLGGLVVVALVVLLIVQSPFGRVLVGIRDSESRMSALGYSTWHYRFTAFVISATLAAVPGVLTAFDDRFVSPSTVNVLVSAQALLVVILGAGSLIGPAVAGAVLVWTEESLASLTDHWPAVVGGLYILVAVVDLSSLGRRLRAWSRAMRVDGLPDDASAPEGTP